ncbi:MAG: putative Ig domain-containing protein, partial [Acidimicrobiales bacterium]
PDAEVGASYQTTLSGTTVVVNGRQIPHGWQIAGVTDATGAQVPLPGGLSLDPNTGEITGTPMPGAEGSYSVQVALDDTAHGHATKSLPLTVLPPISITSPVQQQPATVGRGYSDSLVATGGSGSSSWSIASGTLPTGLGLASDGTITGTPAAGTATAVVEVSVHDSANGSASAWIVVPVGATITTTSLLPAEVGVAYKAILHAAGSPSTPYTWKLLGPALPAGLALRQDATDSSVAAIVGTPTGRPGPYLVRLRLTDAAAGTWLSAMRLTVQPRPRVLPELPGGDIGVGYKATPGVSGGLGPFTWSLAPGSGPLPPGLSIEGAGSATIPAGTIYGTPQATGSYPVILQATDHALVTAQAPTTIVVNPDPTVTTTPLPTAAYAVPYSVTLATAGGTSAAGSPDLWSLAPGDQLPPGLTLDPATGVISGTPSLAAVGTSSTLHVTVTDYWGAQAGATLTLQVERPLAFLTSSLPGAEVGARYSAALQASGGTSPYTWRVANMSLPPGLSLDAATGVVSGRPSQAGAADPNLALCVTDAAGAEACNDHSLGLSVASAVDVATASLPGEEQGKGFTVQLLAGGGAPGYQWSLSGHPLSPWLFLSSDGILWGTAPASAGGETFEVPIQVSDSLAGAASATLSLTIGGPLTLSASSLPPAEDNLSYDTTLAASGGTPYPSVGHGPYYDWFVTSGTLPPGFSINPRTGEITGAYLALGQASYHFTVEVEDAKSDTAAAGFTITIVPPPSIANAGLAPGTVGSPYSATLSANDGVAPYSWSIARGSSLPAWLSLSPSGLLSGTPSASDVGQPSFTVQVTDAAGGTATQALSVRVTPVGLAITTPATLPPATPGQAYSEALTASGGYPPYDWYVVNSLLPSWLSLSFSNGAYSLTGTPPQSAAGVTSTFELEVLDSTGAPGAVTETFTLAVSAPKPAITTTSPLPAATGGQYYDQTLAATGGNGSYTWSVPSGST